MIVGELLWSKMHQGEVLLQARIQQGLVTATANDEQARTRPIVDRAGQGFLSPRPAQAPNCQTRLQVQVAAPTTEGFRLPSFQHLMDVCYPGQDKSP